MSVCFLYAETACPMISGKRDLGKLNIVCLLASIMLETVLYFGLMQQVIKILHIKSLGFLGAPDTFLDLTRIVIISYFLKYPWLVGIMVTP
jgi:hypothetical protein